ncbi:hypothetical protein DR864_11760 [Runella rosea]|uniref:Uncharacterized protein n=1 Tax=Runella rosea TaxID=2259595 RepID=A0A344TIA5_9BACT|nr:hypothetical protein [Runella rosea]AXE18376.1 hypothetical protein DR864_11760 [Runella rosea]
MKKLINSFGLLWLGMTYCFGQSNSIVIINLAPSQNLFFYERTKYLYPNRKYHHHLQAKEKFKSDTVILSGKSPNVLVFEEQPAKMIPVFVFPKDTLRVRIDPLGKLIFEGTNTKEWQMMKQFASHQSFTEPYFFSVNFKYWKDVQENLDSIQKNVTSIIKQSQVEYKLSEEYIAYLQKERNYQWMSSLLHHRNKSFKDLPLEIKSMKNDLLGDSLNYGSMFRLPALYTFVQAECNCYSKDTFPDSMEFSALFKYIRQNYYGATRSQLLLNILYEQIAITPNYRANTSLYEPYLNEFYRLSTDKDYNEFIQEHLKDYKNARY